MPFALPGTDRPTSLMVTSWSYEARAFERTFITAVNPSSTAWGTANRAVHCPIVLQQPGTFTDIFWVNGSVIAGNVDCGVYSEAWSLIASTGSTAQSGGTTVQQVNVTDFTLAPGRYFLAISASDATATFFAANATDALRMPLVGWTMEASALPLPATATPVLSTHTVVPMFGLSRRGTI